MTDPRPGRLPADRLHLLPRHREKLEALIRAHLHGVEVWAYGSRVNGRSHDGSDLDLVLRGLGLQDIPPGQLADFTEALRDSTIPFLVEARDWARLPEHFHCEIERGYVVLVEGEEQRVGDECQEAEEVNRGMAGNVHSKTLRDYFTLQRGTTYKSRLLEQPGPVLLGLATIQRNGGFRSDSLRTYGGDSPKNLLVQPGELYASLKDVTQSADLLGAVARLPVGHAPGRLTQDTVKLEPKFEGVPIDYIYWLLRTPQSRAYCRAHATGTTNLGLPRDDFLALPVPELTATRSSIVNALMALDDKIELNRRMNETLEEMARALFKSWFVDFDPVHAKATLKHHAANQAPRRGDSAQATEAARSGITPPLRGSRQAKGASPQARRRGEIRRLYSPQTLQKAQALRHDQTDAEGLLWHYLCNKQLGGYKFRRQQPIGPYIADFACLPQKLLIELDGGQHATRQDYDEKRDAFLRERGYRVLRFWNNEVFENCLGVLERVYAVLPHHPPLEGGSKDASLSGRETPLRNSRRLTAWLLRLPLKGGVIGRSSGLGHISMGWTQALPRCSPIVLLIRSWGRYRRGGRRISTLDKIALLNPETWTARNAPKTVLYVDLSNTKWGTIEKYETYEWKDAPSRAKRVLRIGDTILGTVRPGNGSYAFISEEGLTGSTGFRCSAPDPNKRSSNCMVLRYGIREHCSPDSLS